MKELGEDETKTSEVSKTTTVKNVKNGITCEDLSEAMLKSTKLYQSYEIVTWSSIKVNNSVYTYEGMGEKGKRAETLKILVDTQGGTIYFVGVDSSLTPLDFDTKLKSKKCK